jgi:hypothetical protein
MPDAGCWMLDAGCWMPDAGCWMPDARCRGLNRSTQHRDAFSTRRTGEREGREESQQMGFSSLFSLIRVEKVTVPKSFGLIQGSSPASGIRHPASSIQHPASSIRHLF